MSLNAPQYFKYRPTHRRKCIIFNGRVSDHLFLKYCGAFRDVNLNYFTHFISVILYFIIQHFFHLLFLFVVSLHSMLSIKEQEGSFSWLLKKEFGSLLNLYQRWEA